MAKIQNSFSKGIIDKDNDERYVENGALIDAENFVVSTTEGSNLGVGKNVPGNVKVSNFNIPGGKNVGTGINERKNKVYDFVKGTLHDYIIEFDVETETHAIVLQDVTGGVLNFIEGERIINVNIISTGEEQDDLLAWSGDSNPPRIVNIERAKTWSLGGFTEDEISVMKPSPIFAPSVNLTTSLDGLENNFLEDKFICFAYRYKYADGFYSAPSSWSRVAFEPRQFRVDFQTYENNGMLNLSNAAEVGFNVGPREVLEVELLFRESNSQTVYVIDSFNKEKEAWANNTTQTFEFSKSKVFKVLPEDQFFRNFDNVPLSAFAQTMIGNRIAYANYIEGYDLGVDIDMLVELVSTVPFLSENNGTPNNYVDVTDYSNVVDFEDGNADGGTSPVNQMNYTTNVVEMDLTGATGADFSIKITPKAIYSSVPYNILVKSGATTVATFSGVGTETKIYTRTTDADISVYVISTQGLIYDCELKYQIKNGVIYISKYIYQAVHQLSFPKSTGYGATHVGDTIIDSSIEFDLTGFLYESGNQIRINMELQSSLEGQTSPSVTFFYNLTNNYTDLTDFITNSDFKNSLENVFSESFKLSEISNSGTFVSYQGFKVTYVGSILTIRTPKVVYDVTELSAITENKNEFFIVTEAELLSVKNGSFTSLHSNRDVEVCQIYLDEKGRKTTALVSPNNSVHIPAEKSSFVNKLKVTLNHQPPAWAKYYKFGVKQVKKQYETIYGNQVYKDGIYRWIKLVGENKNKVKEGDLLTVKSDYSGPLEYLVKAKVLEIKEQDKNFIVGNLLSGGNELVEESGLYMKIKQGNFDINIDENSFMTFSGSGKRRYASRSFVSTSPLFGEYSGMTFTPIEVKAGSQIRFYVSIKAFGAIAFNHVFEVITYAQEDYARVQYWWEAEIGVLDGWNNFQANYLKDWQFGTDGSDFQVKPWRDGTASRDIMTDITFDINFSGGTLVFETEPFENLATSFFETPETFTITDGEHEAPFHILTDAFDCFSFNNGVESFKIQDAFIGKSFSIDANPTAVNQEGYKKINRFADITYSGVFNSDSNVNKLNEFNLSLANYKNDIEKMYGPIVKIKGENTNLEVYQEDKDSFVFYGKDLLYNADGSSNLSRIEDVLGQQKTYPGEYGISFHPDSFDNYAYDSYHTDVKRGVVLKKNDSNGLFEISSQGMRNYFKKLFRDNTITHINGKYDQFHDYYILNIQYGEGEYVTWVYSDKNNGWLGRMKFNPEDMVRINNHFISFKNGEVYKHNQASVYNTFYGVESPSKFSFNFSQDPSIRKNFKALDSEGTDAWKINVNTDLDSGYINKEDFVKKEGVFYAYLRNNNDTVDTSLLSCQGIGEITAINSLVLTFDSPIDSVISVGDVVRNTDLEVVGTIVSKTENTLTLNAVANVVVGDFVMSTKNQSIENQSLLGYYMQVDCELSKITATEIYAIGCEISESKA